MQQVNLYQPILRKQEKVFSAKTLLQGNLVVLAGLVLIYVYTLFQTQNIEAQLEQAKQQRDNQIKRLATLSAQYPEKPKDPTLASRIAQARAELQHKQRLLDGVAELGLDTSVEFSKHLEGLARQDLPNLWLQQIFLRYGQQVELKGSAYLAEEVPVYLQRLSKENAFNGTTFQSVVIARSEEHDDRVDFTLSTQPPKAEGEE
jgi:hypothetical protein